MDLDQEFRTDVDLFYSNNYGIERVSGMAEELTKAVDNVIYILKDQKDAMKGKLAGTSDEQDKRDMEAMLLSIPGYIDLLKTFKVRGEQWTKRAIKEESRNKLSKETMARTAACMDTLSRKLGIAHPSGTTDYGIFLSNNGPLIAK